MDDILLDLYYGSELRNEELEQTIAELKSELKYRTNENKSLYKEINRLREVIEIKDADRIELCKQVERYAKDIDNANNDYKKCYAENVRLAEENNYLNNQELLNWQDKINEISVR